MIFKVGRSSSVFDFYAYLLGKLEGRKKILGRLGMEAEDVLDSFLDEALTFTNDRNGGLETFITELTNAEPIIKREVELDRDEVRILTVHSSKGLEARVVFLIDHCGAAWSERHRPEILTIHDETHKKGYLWLTGKDQHVSATVESAALISEAAEAEYRRLLYVSKEQAAIEPKTADGNDGKSKNAQTIPDWLWTPAKADPPLPRPLTPSGAYALIDRENLSSEALKFKR